MHYKNIVKCTLVILSIITFNSNAIIYANSNNKNTTKSVIILPGISGTQFYKDNHIVWPPRQLYALSDISDVMCNSAGNPVKTLRIGDPVYSSYSKLYKSLASIGLKPHYFGYDWRLDNNHSELMLEKYISKVMQQDKSKKVILVAHSMGGLVAAKYIAKYPQNVEKFIAIGVPFLGTPKALDTFETGSFFGDWKDSITGILIKQLSINFKSVYQLLPSKYYFNIQNCYVNSPKKIIGFKNTRDFLLLRFPGYCKSYFNTSDDFYNSIEKVYYGQKYAFNDVDSYFIVGSGIPTMGEIDLTNYDLSPIDGDSTVPIFSATVGNRANPNKCYYIKASHGSLPCNTNVLNQIGNILKNNYKSLANCVFKKPISTHKIKLQILSPLTSFTVYNDEMKKINTSYSMYKNKLTSIFELQPYTIIINTLKEQKVNFKITLYNTANQIIKTYNYNNMILKPSQKLDISANYTDVKVTKK